jgi:protein O-mannosyl-transferase
MRKAEVPLPPQAGALAARSQIPWWLPALGLVLGTMVLYWPATRCDFLNYDDPLNLTENVLVLKGLTWAGLKEFFFNPYVLPSWTPMTMLSHMVAVQVFGLNPWGHHLINVVLHAINAVLVFALLQQVTGAKWRSLWVAVFFAVHPLRVEAVAWVTIRRELLLTFFGLLSLIAYVRYAQGRRQNEEGSEARHAPRNTGPSQIANRQSQILWYWVSWCCFGLACMSKQNAITWPFMMLLLDYWPLGRMQNAECRMQNSDASKTPHATRHTPHLSGLTPQSQIANRKSQILWPLLVEKIPFFVNVVCIVIGSRVVLAFHSALEPGTGLPLGARIGNAMVSYCGYLGSIFWPTDLAVLYPHPGQSPLGQVALAGGLLLGISALALALHRRHPYLLMGWLWFCGTLVPMSGAVAVGIQLSADRWTYVPSLGVLILLVWGAGELVRGRPEVQSQKSEDGKPRHATGSWAQSQILLWAAGGAAMVLCLAMTRHQLGYWKDSEVLFRHAIAVTKGNYGAYNNLGSALSKKGQFEEAIRQFQAALRIKPAYPQALINLGAVLGQRGEVDQAILHLREAVRLNPNFRDGHYLLGLALVQNSQLDEAIRQFQEALHVTPDHVGAHYDLGLALARKGEMDQAIPQLREAIRLDPDHVGAHINLGVALSQKGEMDEAIRQYQEALRLKPEDAAVHFNLGAAWAKRGQLAEAIRHYQAALRLEPARAEAHNNLGTIFHQQGRTGEAIREFQEALRLKPDYAEARKNLAVALAAPASSAPPPGAATNR